MMAFELEVTTKARVLEVVVLSQKNRQPDEDPGAKLSLQALVGNDVLSCFDGALKGVLFRRNEERAASAGERQATLDGIAPVSDLPDLTGIGSHVKTLAWADKLTGYRLSIEHGIGGRSNIVLDDCTLGGFRLQPQQGGTVLVKFDLESPNVSGPIWAKLAKLKSTEVGIILLAPEVAQQGLDDGGPPWAAEQPQPTAPAPDATSAFLAAHGREGARP